MHMSGHIYLLKPSNRALTQTDNINSLPSQFLDFFENNIQKIRENFVPELQINPQHLDETVTLIQYIKLTSALLQMSSEF